MTYECRQMPNLSDNQDFNTLEEAQAHMDACGLSYAETSPDGGTEYWTEDGTIEDGDDGAYLPQITTKEQ